MFWFEFLIWLYTLPSLIWISAIFYNKGMNKILSTKNRSYISFFDELYSFEGLSYKETTQVDYKNFTFIFLSTVGGIFIFLEIICFFARHHTTKDSKETVLSVERGFYTGLLFLGIEVILIIIIVLICLFMQKKKYSVNIQLNKIEAAIKNAPSADIKETLERAEKRLQDQMKMSIIKEGIDALQELQQSVDCIDIQFELDKLKAYEKLSENDYK